MPFLSEAEVQLVPPLLLEERVELIPPEAKVEYVPPLWNATFLSQIYISQWEPY